MKKLFAILSALILVIGLTACSQTPKTEVKYLPLEVTHEMAPDYIVKYVYHYNEDWVQTGITTYINGELESETTYELDLEHNQITKMITTAPDGATAEIEYQNTFDEKGNLILQEQYAEGILVTVNEYTYDKDGNRLSQALKNPSNSSTNILTWDANGNLLRTESIIDAVGERPASHSWKDYTYDENGKEIKSVNYYNNGDDCMTAITEYDTQGRKVKQTSTNTLDGLESPNSVREYTYDGNTVTETAYEADGKVGFTATSTYDDAGNLLSSETVTEYSINRSTYTYQKVEVPVK